jgi:hypothetical protein
MPSLQTPTGCVPDPVVIEPSGLKSAAFQSARLSPATPLVTATRCPSKAAWNMSQTDQRSRTIA